ncbi:5-formyltetrahydrofolate cyclo-ligase [Leptolyngbya sp. FACHB-261]|uniref:5-formyltetrahydrofolate cyclo-ligase n=1 Tax=Leptolyngbya sp. FACHB-261 TaxID=2692806 RepID=UPI001684D6DE|nr:5-formyltetrahydrofolate cyclo-ligase [Leptolyngbya sp. FACHB-261]MBD2105094.1 5-formyltetrahydrofolate cyclo-ligase [Leptolyngbya sp. FACHB-261]
MAQPPSSVITNKASLRRQFLTARLALSAEIWDARTASVCERLRAWPCFQNARTVLAYTSFRREPDLSSLWQQSTEKTWAFPRCVGKSLSWHQLLPGALFERGQYGIWEPTSSWPSLDLREADLLLIPALACDHRGYRLGYGGGFYDRLLMQLDLTGLLTAGIVFHEAWVDTLPIAVWDRPLQTICTDVGVFAV